MEGLTRLSHRGRHNSTLGLGFSGAGDTLLGWGKVRLQGIGGFELQIRVKQEVNNLIDGASMCAF